MKKMICLYFFFTIFFAATTLFAHRISVFCWVEGNKAKCESSFSPGGEPVKNGKIEVWCLNTNKLLIKGVTNSKGEFEFELPKGIKDKKWKLKVICNASMGHKNFWTITPEDYLEEEEADTLTEQKSKVADNSSSKTLNKTSSTSSQEIKKVVLEVIRKELDPIKRELAQMNEKKITVGDVMGGIGYIFGLMGIVFYFKARGKSS